MRQQTSATAYIGYGQFDDVAGFAAWSCFIVVVFFDVDIPLQSLAFPLSLLAPLPAASPLLVPLVVLAPEPLLLFMPLSDPEPEGVEVPEPAPDPLPLVPDCWASTDVARPRERADTARIFKNMIFSLDVLCLPTSNKYRPGMFQRFPLSNANRSCFDDLGQRANIAIGVVD
ncbi:hypothetical protein PH547_15765 [Rhizobium sp. CNPSo 3464]|uniref:hypothetical protein n=1 Tax=Rhizobium sp. CNPSo 3464 TaxID=3021406 RepID=UPI00254E41D9|nr:hypothetical protein [Rhizobium sp. CNPSo 3464]MDK4740339.1 hypothetical protein [Rhizobium sp. CNPSo 3464]